jgi:hypothetical protein
MPTGLSFAVNVLTDGGDIEIPNELTLKVLSPKEWSGHGQKTAHSIGSEVEGRTYCAPMFLNHFMPSLRAVISVIGNFRKAEGLV